MIVDYNRTMLVSFLEDLITFDQKSRSAIDLQGRVVNDRAGGERSEWEKMRASAVRSADAYAKKTVDILSEYRKKVDSVSLRDIEEKKAAFKRLDSCKSALALIKSAESSITDKAAYTAAAEGGSAAASVTIMELISGQMDFAAKAGEVNAVLGSGKKRAISDTCSAFFSLCRKAEQLLEEEIIRLRAEITRNQSDLRSQYPCPQLALSLFQEPQLYR